MGQKWCEYCHINLPYDKKAIQEHEYTRNHLANKRREVNFQRNKAIQYTKKKQYEAKKNALLGTANVPKAKQGSYLYKQVTQYRNDVISQAKTVISLLIAEKTQGLYGAPIEYPEKEELVLAENYLPDNNNNDEDNEYGLYMWKIDICEETGDACFINTVTKAVLYEPPKGYILSEKHKYYWEYLKYICRDKVVLAGDNVGTISEWQEVEDEDDYFKINEVKEELKEEYGQNNNIYLASVQANHVKAEELTHEVQYSWMDHLEQAVNNNYMTADYVFETVIYNKLKYCKHLREQNDTLKKLVVHNIEIRTTAKDVTYQQNLYVKLYHYPYAINFKARKRVKTAKLTDDNDLYH